MFAAALLEKLDNMSSRSSYHGTVVMDINFVNSLFLNLNNSILVKTKKNIKHNRGN